MHILNIVTSPRKEKSASTAIVNAFLAEYRAHVRDVIVDRLDVWQSDFPSSMRKQSTPNTRVSPAKLMTPIERATWEKIRELASPFQRADRIVLGVPM
jgi:FMN-dependent NADH-azoreductase